jgi:hypothetical protein
LRLVILPNCFRPFLKQLLASLILRIVRVPNLEPIFTIRRIPALRHDPFEIGFAHQPEEIASVSLEVAGVKNPWMLVHHPSKNVLALQQWHRAEIPSIEHQDIEGVKSSKLALL